MTDRMIAKSVQWLIERWFEWDGIVRMINTDRRIEWLRILLNDDRALIWMQRMFDLSYDRLYGQSLSRNQSDTQRRYESTSSRTSSMKRVVWCEKVDQLVRGFSDTRVQSADRRLHSKIHANSSTFAVRDAAQINTATTIDARSVHSHSIRAPRCWRSINQHRVPHKW